MKKQPLTISFILDETGSMEPNRAATISAFNEYLETLRKGKGMKGALFALTKFNSEKVEVVYDGAALSDVLPLTDQTYQPNFNTPLYDAVGGTINALVAKGAERVLMIIQTDGEENASLEFSREQIISLIEERKTAGWTFAFLGADIDAYAASANLGIARGNTIAYAAAAPAGTMSRAAEVSVAYAASGGSQTSTLFEERDDEKEPDRSVRGAWDGISD